MADPTGVTTGTFPYKPALTGREMLWNQMKDPTTGVPMDAKTAVDDISNYTLGKIVPTNLDPTNAAIADVKAAVGSLATAVGSPLQAGGTMIVGNDATRAVPVHVDNQPTYPAFPTSMVVTGNVGITGTPTVLLGGLPIPTLGLAATATRAGTSFRAYLPFTNLTALGTTLVLALCNPAGSGRTIYITRTGVSCGTDGKMFRGRVADATKVTGTAGSPISQSGGVSLAGVAVASVARIVPFPALASGTTPAYELGIPIKASTPYENPVNGESAIPSGQAALWAVAPTATIVTALLGAPGEVAGFIEWVEV